MKRGLLLGIFIFIFLISLLAFLPFISSQEETCDDDCKVDKAYTCLDENVGDCSTLTPEEKIFSLLAIGKCKDEVLLDSSNNECWPAGSCDLKTTAQAILALNNVRASTDEAKSWLSSENISSSDIIWYLQIESTGATSCSISYDTSLSTINIGEDKKPTITGATSCLKIDTTYPYWLKIDSTCYDEEFSISCDKSFSTTWLYRKTKTGSSTIYVSGKTNTASAGGTITEKINSLCFSQGTSCDYEGSLWAAIALDPLDDYDVTPFLPYLITMADENEKYIPEAFLLILTGEFETELLDKQKTVNNQYYWEMVGGEGKYFDTALALYPFQYEDPKEKTDSKNWLLTVQTEEGCWDTTRNTAFILHSLWPGRSPIAPSVTGEIDCEDAGYFCLSSISCSKAGGEELDDYSCAMPYVCCSEELVQPTCSAQEGEICSDTETCDGASVDASDLSYGETCCIGGSCEEIEEGEISECELEGGICKTSCSGDESEIFKSCEFSSDVCCIAKEKKPIRYIGIIIFSALIFLVVMAILLRKKLKMYWFKLKSRGKGPASAPSARPGFPPPPRPIFSPIRRPMPPSRFVLRPKPRGEVSDVLKRLKEMGK